MKSAAISPTILAAVAMLGLSLGPSDTRAEPAPSVLGLFQAAWKRSGCNQPIDLALNNSRYHELGGGYSLGMVLCWLGRDSESLILFVVAPKTGGRPQLLRFEAWRDKAFTPADALPMAAYDPQTRKVTSYHRYRARGTCGYGGEWTWGGSEFAMTGYWDKPDCSDDSEFDRSDRFRIFPPKQ